MATQMAGLENDEKVYENLQKLQFDKDNVRLSFCSIWFEKLHLTNIVLVLMFQLEDIENKKLPLEKEKLIAISEDCDEIRNSIEEVTAFQKIDFIFLLF